MPPKSKRKYSKQSRMGSVSFFHSFINSTHKATYEAYICGTFMFCYRIPQLYLKESLRRDLVRKKLHSLLER